MKSILNKKILVSLVIVFAIIIMQGKVNAIGGQAEGTRSLYNKTVSYFFELIRVMESPTGTLCKDSDINQTTFVDNSKNGIDCHLEKNTEYGTITILAASDYGNAESTDSKSTGANNTGVFQMNNGYYEYVANTWQQTENDAVRENDYNKALTKADSRYVNKYIGKKDDYKSKGYVIQGDGIWETDGLGGSTYFVDSSYPVFGRGNSGLFGYGNGTGNSSSVSGARAVVVCAPGL